jgi:hypothetical protein
VSAGTPLIGSRVVSLTGTSHFGWVFGLFLSGVHRPFVRAVLWTYVCGLLLEIARPGGGGTPGGYFLLLLIVRTFSRSVVFSFAMLLTASPTRPYREVLVWPMRLLMALGGLAALPSAAARAWIWARGGLSPLSDSVMSDQLVVPGAVRETVRWADSVWLAVDAYEAASFLVLAFWVGTCRLPGRPGWLWEVRRPIPGFALFSFVVRLLRLMGGVLSLEAPTGASAASSCTTLVTDTADILLIPWLVCLYSHYDAARVPETARVVERRVGDAADHLVYYDEQLDSAEVLFVNPEDRRMMSQSGVDGARCDGSWMALPVTLLLIKKDSFSFPGSRQHNSLREMVRLASHPCLVRVHGYTYSNRWTVVVEERLEGFLPCTSVFADERRARPYLPDPALAAVAADAARAIVALRRSGLALSDIGPGSLFVRVGPRDADAFEGGFAKLTALAASASASASEKPAPAPAPKLNVYTAPEVLRGGPETEKSMVYSVAVVLLHLSTGEAPASFPVAVPPGLALASLLGPCLAEDPAQRPAAEGFLARSLVLLASLGQPSESAIPTAGPADAVAAITEIALQVSHLASAPGPDGRGGVDELDQILSVLPGLARLADADGRTPLHVATVYAHRQAVECLLRHGADPLAPDNEGVTPQDLDHKRLLQRAK